MQPRTKHANPEQRQSGFATWKAALGIAAAAAALPVILFSGSEFDVEATESASARRLRPRSEWMAEHWGSQWADVEREVREREGGADWLAHPVGEVNVPSWESVSKELRSAFVEELLASRERFCQGFVGDRRMLPEQVLAILGENAWFEFSAADMLAIAGLAQAFDEAIARAASNAFDLVLELDDALWAQAEYDRGLFYLPQCTSVIDLAPKTGVAFMRAQACGPWLVRYVLDCAKDPRIQAAHDQIRALQIERDAALRAAAEEWRAP